MKLRKHKQRAFTLLEMLITIGIFAFIYIAVASFLSSSLQGREQLEQGATELERTQRAMTFLTLDFEQLISRPVRDAYGDAQAALVGGEGRVEFTRLGWSNPFGLRQRSEMQRVAYFLENGDLYRRFWPVLDSNVATEYQEEVLVEDVARFSLKYLTQTDQGDWQWLEQWPDPAVFEEQLWQLPLPRSIELEVELTSGDILHRYYRTVVNPWL